MLNGLSIFIIKRYKLIFAISIIVFILAGLVAMNIGMDSNMEGMLPQNSESLKSSKEYEQYFDSQDNVLVVVQGAKNQSESFLRALEERLTTEDIVNNALYRVDMSQLEEYLHLYLDTSYYRDLEEELNSTNSSLSIFLRQLDFISLTDLFVERLEGVSPLDKERLLDSFTKLLLTPDHLSKSEEKDLFSTLIFGEILGERDYAEYLVSDSSDTYLMILKPNIDMEFFVENRTSFFNSLETAIEDIKQAGGYNVAVGITGGAFVQDHEADNMMFDGFLSTALITFVLIILFIIFSFKRILLPISMGYPLLLGTVMATSFAYLVYRNLNLFSISFAVLLMGLGIDFAVHIISRYLEEREGGKDVRAAVTITITHTSSSMLVGAITTAIVFFTFLAAEFKAFTQMGVISGSGILLLCITMILMVPTIIMFYDTRKKSQNPAVNTDYSFLAPIGRIVEKRPLTIVIPIALVTLFLFNNVLRTDIKTDMSKIYPQEMESLKWLEVVEAEFDYNPTTLMFMVDHMKDLETATEMLSQRQDVTRLESILNYLPEDQEYKVRVISKLKYGLGQSQKESLTSSLEILEAINHLKGASDAQGIDKASTGYRALENLQTALKGGGAHGSLMTLTQKLSLDGIKDMLLTDQLLTIDKLPHSLQANFVGTDGKLSIEVIPNVNIWEPDSFQQLAIAIREVSGRHPVGMPAMMNEVTTYVKNDILKISSICIIALFIILFMMFKNLKDAFITTIPLLVTLYTTLGLLPILGEELNIFSIVAFPVLIGIGVDSGVHLLHRIKTTQDKDLPYILSHTGKAIMMTTITTLIGFGSLYFTNHPGLSSFGLTTIIGMSLCLVITITLLPALHRLLYTKKHDQNAEM